MNKRIFMIFMIAVILLTTTGCQLALEDQGEEKSSDRLIGVFISYEYLDLFDFEGYLNDNIGKFTDGASVKIEDDSNKYQGRLYATLKDITHTDEEGNTFNTSEYVFEGVEGISYFAAKVPATLDDNSYFSSGADEAISDAHTGYFLGDVEDKITLDGTIYISLGYASQVYFINPVCQSSDGKVYATSGNGIMLGGVLSEGTVQSQTLDETKTITENGQSKTISTSVKISISAMYNPQKISILQLDKNSNIISRDEYTPGELPETISPGGNVDYIIVETIKKDNAGKLITSRTLFDQKKESLDTFYIQDNGICVKQWTRLDW